MAGDTATIRTANAAATEGGRQEESQSRGSQVGAGMDSGLAGSLGRPGRGAPKRGGPGGVAGRYKKDRVAL